MRISKESMNARKKETEASVLALFMYPRIDLNFFEIIIKYYKFGKLYLNM